MLAVVVEGGGTTTEYESDNTASGPDLTFTSLTAPSSIDLATASQLGVSFTLKNQGNQTAYNPLGILVAFYLSEDNNITTDDVLVGIAGTLLNAPSGIEPGSEYNDSVMLDLSANIPNGEYYFGAIVDPRSYTLEHISSLVVDMAHIVETDENNNVSTAYLLNTTASLECTDDAYEYDDSPSDASILSLSQAQTHNFCFDSADWFKFEATAGNMYIIDTYDLGRYTDTYLSLYDSDASTLILANDSGVIGTRDAKITWTASESGTYYVKASNHDHENFTTNYAPGLYAEYTISLQ